MSSGFRAVGSALGAGTNFTGTYGSETDVLNYLRNYDTQTYDNTLGNMVNQAYAMSQNLGNTGNYTFSVDGSDAARQRAENATWQAYADRLQPQFDQQTANLETRLQNQGITVGSNAYNQAMSNLLQSQNDSYNQAAYQSVLNGQNAFSNSLNDSVSAANFGNSAQQNYINQIMSLLQGSRSGYDNAMDIYSIQNGIDRRSGAASQANALEQEQAGLNAAITAAQFGAMFSDVRLKENIRPVGQLYNGLTVYCFNFAGSPVPQLGLLAQEVAEICPEAVSEDENGYLLVRYDEASSPSLKKGRNGHAF